MVWRRNGKVGIRGEILESEPPRRLIYIFDYIFDVERPGPMHDRGPSMVEYRIEAFGQKTRLTVLHSNFLKDSVTRESIEQGWPPILSGLKTILEGGTLRDAKWDEEAQS